MILSNQIESIRMPKIDDYMDQAFATDDTEKRQKYREAIRQMEQLLILVSEIE